MSAQYVGLAARFPMDIINHLHAYYIVIYMGVLSKTYNIMKAQFGVNLPIEGLFCQIQDAVDFSNANGAPYTPL